MGCIDLSKPVASGEALKFGGFRHEPVDYIETHYESDSSSTIAFNLIKETESFGSRLAGLPVRRKLENLIRMNAGRRIVVDLKDIPIVSSSFADEVFGKLFVQMGAIAFMTTVQFSGVSDTVRSLIDRAIIQRSQDRR